MAHAPCSSRRPLREACQAAIARCQAQRKARRARREAKFNRCAAIEFFLGDARIILSCAAPRNAFDQGDSDESL
jgi:hypothetical protein